ncbi:hypothetical protein pEaSNUABM28_00253 [Erwinia phage pEa_SNUABM_28]|uniref:Uncharacterized protein n=1 Tax=Erwinia phage pEa_SNUABM_16 TaxID=2869544 RepID=A0AAE8XQS9_9CAUD|nr:hypothetical protein MPK64_gp251 [Erwinia phage pEa_SNUABM_16]QZE58810.1 hypothetical protein pEaSNUABM28_00253 [Erwinia phage pEa_SNUABM_28]QZE59154.1 hypothetical protein pEaSNUABM18_00251 [Erwinia phage pEa_SNUABM_18]UAW96395.1 hypothetical protein pEaSNUABM16_00251 [Erwinia phage pEa_SNUABM_16]
MKSRVQHAYIPDMESFDPYVRSLCHMARALDTPNSNYGKLKRVVIIGTSKRVVEAYVKQLLNTNTLPHTLICFGVDEPPISHRDYTYAGAHVVLMHDLTYVDSGTMDKVATRVIEIIDSLKQKPGETELKNSELSMVYSNPLLWRSIIDYGASVSLRMNGSNIEYRSGLVSSIGFDALLRCESNADYHELRADKITIGLEFFCVHTDYLLSKVHNLLWSLACDDCKFKKTHRIIFHEDFRRLFFEEYLLRDFQGF